MVWSSTCLVMSSSLCIAPCLLMSISSGACTAKTLCWPALITAKQIFVKYRTMVIIISKSRFGSISIDRIIIAISFWPFCSLTSKHRSLCRRVVSNTTHPVIRIILVPAVMVRTACYILRNLQFPVEKFSTLINWQLCIKRPFRPPSHEFATFSAIRSLCNIFESVVLNIHWRDVKISIPVLYRESGSILWRRVSRYLVPGI